MDIINHIGNKKVSRQEEGGKMRKIEPWIESIQVHVLAGCSDARDLSAAYNTAKDTLIENEKSGGNLIDMPRISVPGVFATPEVVGSITGIIFSKEKEYAAYTRRGVKVSYFVHMMAHGNACLKHGCRKDEFNYHNIEIKEAAFNCGMMGAKGLALEFEQLILSEKPTLAGRRITSLGDIEQFMLETHHFNGTIAGNWIEGIGNLATHPFAQKKILRAAFDADPKIKSLKVRITAGVQNYATNEYFRVDDNTHLITIIDRIYENIGSGQEGEQKKRVSKQMPKVLAFHDGSIVNARERIMREYSGGSGAFGGDVFAITGRAPMKEFGPYKTIGFYYALHPHHLKLADHFVVCGRTKKKTDEMVARLKHSELVKFGMDAFKAKVHPIVLGEFPKKSPVIQKR